MFKSWKALALNTLSSLVGGKPEEVKPPFQVSLGVPERTSSATAKPVLSKKARKLKQKRGY